MDRSQDILKLITSLVPGDKKVRIMNVCGSHEHTIAYAGMRSILPENLEIIPGPGCPVCVCPESDIINAIELSKRPDSVVLTYGDMLRVPTRKGSLRSEGIHYKMITSPLETIHFAKSHPNRKVVFFSTGFETTTAPTAAMFEMDIPGNLFILSSHRLTPTIMEILVKDQELGIDGFIAPGHVSAIVGSNAWNVFSEKYGIPTVVAGFEADNLLFGIAEILKQLKDGRASTGNVYGKVVKPEGNVQAQKIMYTYMKVADVNWRGIGHIPASGLELRDEYDARNARKVFELKETRETRMPGCICGNVILGKAYPAECTLFKKTCTPKKPKGPCMVSMEGACNIWYKTDHKST